MYDLRVKRSRDGRSHVDLDGLGSEDYIRKSVAVFCYDIGKVDDNPQPPKTRASFENGGNLGKSSESIWDFRSSGWNVETPSAKQERRDKFRNGELCP